MAEQLDTNSVNVDFYILTMGIVAGLHIPTWVSSRCHFCNNFPLEWLFRVPKAVGIDIAKYS